ncbi:hypothetical protein HDE_05237 [Halotydeus destructor]|nr:hypothetical protein HDE_05237 [Halotydeus destructor]
MARKFRPSCSSGKDDPPEDFQNSRPVRGPIPPPLHLVPDEVEQNNLLELAAGDNIDVATLLEIEEPVAAGGQPQPEVAEVRQMGGYLYREFVAEQFPHVFTEQLMTPRTAHAFTFGDGYNDPHYALVGRELSRLALMVAQSDERQQIRQRAAQVDINLLDADQFRAMLLELFCDGISRERIVVLFFFVTDLAGRCLEKGQLGMFSRFISWSLSFIQEYICDWVHRQGGWSVVLSTYVPRAVYTVAGILTIMAMSVYIKNNWS